MKQIKTFLWPIALVTVILTSCLSDDDIDNSSVNATRVAYIVNYGNYSGSKSEISVYDIKNQTITQNAYKTANQVDFTSNIQSMAIYKDKAYCMSNNGDKIDVIDARTLKQTQNPVSAEIVKPRYFAANGNTAFISCWGDVKDWSKMAESYIAKIDLTTRTVKKIALPGGVEGVIIVNNKLYCGMTTTNKVAVIDIATDAVSYIEVSAVPQQFVIDGSNNLWVSLVSKYSTPFPANKVGLAIINPATNTVAGTVNFPGIGSDGYIQLSPDKKTIYAMGAEAYPGTKATIHKINVTARTLESQALINGENFYGFNVNPESGNIFVLISPGATVPGTLKIYNPSGMLLDEETTGISPAQVVFYNIAN